MFIRPNRAIAVLAILVTLTLTLCGCTAMDRMAGMGVITENNQSFDNSKVIEVSPNSLYAPGKTMGTPFMLGAIWSSSHPDFVGLEVKYNATIGYGSAAYTGITGIDINVDGRIQSFQAHALTSLNSSGYNPVAPTIYTHSENTIAIPYALLESMVAASDCRLRIHTTDGYEDVSFSADHIPGGKATAITTIRPFMQRVDAARGLVRR